MDFLVRQHRWMIAGFLTLSLCGCSTHEGETLAEESNTAEESQTTSQPEAKHAHSNRLSRETSPYLLLHAHNPIDWYSWGPEAFEKAKRDNKPIFLSIGYSSCFWCHVMERKVFSNETIAKYMNEHFVNIKVDREERPDVDDIYMTSLQVYFQAIGSPQGGGWPLSMFLTPQGKPFAGGTYFPPEDDRGQTGFSTVIKRISEYWTNDQKGLEETAESLTRQVQLVMKPRLALASVTIERDLVAGVTKSLMDSYDSTYGGIDFHHAAPTRPKFPVPAKLALLQYAAGNGDKDAEKIVLHTLDSISAGGIQDHLGGGFHRYSTDRLWHVPHFEKMLYDQAQLADVYIEAFHQTGNTEYRKTAEGVFRYLFREMTDPTGGFHSALDAETGGVEGEFYVWTRDEITKTLGRDEAEFFCKVYGLDEPKVFEHGYVLHLPKSLNDVAEELKISPASLDARLNTLRQQLLSLRDKRESLLKDDKILTSWNGLMIRALANTGRVLGNSKYTKAATKAAEFILSGMRDEKGRLHRTFRGKQAKLNAYLDDYAFLVEGLLALYRTTQDKKWLEVARQLTDDQIDLFWDKNGKGFFFTSHHHEELIARTKNAYDAVLPSGNSVSVRNLIQLAQLTGEAKYQTYAEETLKVFAGNLKQTPSGTTNMALAIGEYLDAFETQQKPPTENGENPEADEETSLRSRDDLQSVVLTVAAEAAGEEATSKKKKEELVTIKAFLSVDKLPSGGQCKVVMQLFVKKGWHINANPPKPKFLKPTVFSISSKQNIKLTNIRYPKPKKFELEGFDETLSVYEGQVNIYGVLEIPANLTADTDEVELKVRYQACNDVQCFPPKTLKLTGKISFVASGEPVKQINQKLFPKEKK